MLPSARRAIHSRWRAAWPSASCARSRSPRAATCRASTSQLANRPHRSAISSGSAGRAGRSGSDSRTGVSVPSRSTTTIASTAAPRAGHSRDRVDVPHGREVELAADRPGEERDVRTELVAQHQVDRRDPGAPRGRVQGGAGRGVEEQPELDVAVRVALPRRERAVHQGRADVLVRAAHLPDPGDEFVLDHAPQYGSRPDRATASSRSGAPARAGTGSAKPWYWRYIAANSSTVASTSFAVASSAR